MKNLKLLFISLCLSLITIGVNAQTATDSGNDYFKQKYGIFVHYGWGGDGTNTYGCTITEYKDGTLPKSLNEAANNFDVTGFVNDIAAMRPEYLIFTIWHCGMNPLYPSAVMDKWTGTGNSSSRDVMQELLDACDAKGIDVYFYTQPSAGNSMSPERQAKVSFVNNSKYTLAYNNFINELYAEVANRYKTQFKGFWFDKGLGFGCVDAPRLGATIRGIIPNAVMIKNGFASDAPAAADYGAVEVMSVTVNLADEGYPNADDANVNTWPAFDRSVSWVTDRGWSSEAGSCRYTTETMFKYTILEAGVNEEGGGVAWAMGPFPTTTVSWNTNILSRMTALGVMIDEVGESIKGTVPSDSWPTAQGARIQGLTWGVATRSADGNYEYLHVLKAPTGKTLTIAAPADGRVYTAAVNLRTGKACTISQTATQVIITLNASDSWDAVDSVIKLSQSSSVGTNFTPDPNKTYYIDFPQLALRLASTGQSEDAYTTSTSTTGADVEWKFVDKGNGYWHIDRAAGGTKPRLRSDNSVDADMQQTTSVGENTYFDFPPAATSGTYFITLPEGATDYPRLQINSSGQVKMVSVTNAGVAESFKITEVKGSTLSTNIEFTKDNQLFSVYPNPMKDILNIKLETTKSASYRVFDTNGKLLLTGKINNGAAAVDLSGFANGLYLVKVSNGTISATQKIIKK